MITDHKPLENIWKKPKPPLHIERWGLCLQPYKVQIVYRPGSGNPADYMSRHPPRSCLKSSHEQQMADYYVNLVTRVVTPSALTEEQVRKCTSDDPTLQAVIQMTRDNLWFEIGKYDGQSGVDYDELLGYRSVKEEITVNNSGDMVIRNDKLVILKNFLQQVLSLAHEGHHGLRKTKSYLRSRVWTQQWKRK